MLLVLVVRVLSMLRAFAVPLALAFLLVVLLSGCAVTYSDHWRDCVYLSFGCPGGR